jgi:hypothetical protein
LRDLTDYMRAQLAGLKDMTIKQIHADYELTGDD